MRTLTDSSPVFFRTVLTLRLSTSTTSSGEETDRVRLGAADALRAARTREAMAARILKLRDRERRGDCQGKESSEPGVDHFVAKVL